jgi:aminobenzoyl-glutamate utilization protein B
MVKAGRFGDASAVLTWHPADVNTPHRYLTSANLAAVFSFKGRASHAGMAPYAGRSALDAVQLFNLSMEFMREHLEPGVMLHYVVSDGGQRPNIVPEKAASFLYIRAPSASMVRSVMKRLTKAARGASLMTETSFAVEIKHGKCDYRPNETIQTCSWRRCGPSRCPNPARRRGISPENSRRRWQRRTGRPPCCRLERRRAC